MISISHELPLSLLKYDNKWNGYSFCLPSFYLKYPEYKQHYLEAKSLGREIILDNGIFEGDNFSNEELIEIINELKPNKFVVPDSWNNSEKTWNKAEEWIEDIRPLLPLETKLMVVMQGNTFQEIKELYIDCKILGYTHFAINHSSKSYVSNFHPNILVEQMFGRINLISYLYSSKTIKPNDSLHLLGASLPQEFIYYPEEYNFIKSVDTSSPIINGLLGTRYNRWGMLSKPSPKMEKFMEKEFIEADHTMMSNITSNIREFRNFVKGSKIS